MFLMLKSCKRSAAGEISVSGVLKQFLRRTQKKKPKKTILQNMSIVSNYMPSADKM